MTPVTEYFGSLVFNDTTMKQRLPKETYKALKKTIQDGKPLDISVANVVANAMKDWAIEHGCTHYSHWFQPMTGITAEKHDSFITPTDGGKVIMEFSGKALIKGEPDASSFPNGGIRATFEARGYTTWDPTSYAFIKDGSLCIPTAFCSYTGEVLDKKTPLLRSMERISHEAVRVLHLFGKKDVTRVVTTVGAEQEYFLVDKKVYEKRRDLIYTGRTLIGAKAPKGQELEDHYFGSIKTRVSEYMKDLDEQLWKFGIYSKTKHNEAAPAQHELAPVFTTTNLATDHNQLTMEIMQKVAEKHGLVCLLHEKPFAGVNGSGKHNNWSLTTNTGENLFNPSSNPEQNLQFLLFLAAVIKGVDEYQDLLRVSVASAGNDCRLGGYEAPPAIVSMFIGGDLEAVLEAMLRDKEYESKGKIEMGMGVDVLPEIRKDTTDRNRTSPFAFTGNKFEFRMLGSAINIACPNIMLNTIVAEELSQFADELEKAEDFERTVRHIIKRTYKEHRRIVFNGNNYSEDWVQEAQRRGLLNLRTMPEAMPYYINKKNIALFEKHKIYTAAETHARCEVLLENYVNVVNIEALTLTEMVKRDIIPAVTKYIKSLADTALAKKQIMPEISTAVETKLIEKLSSDLEACYNKLMELEFHIKEVETRTKNHSEKQIQALSEYVCANVLSVMRDMRVLCDDMEVNTSAEYWPYPSYGELMTSV